jgi:putative Mn2+ efflux pump MntP
MAYDELFVAILMSLGLAMDCFAVSVSRGVITRKSRLWNALALATSFGAFQALMPLLGWQLGLRLVDYISGIDHWIAFGLLAAVGLKMVYESRKDEGVRECKPLDVRLLLLLSVATSIDAFAVGLSIAFTGVGITTAVLLIGSVSFALSFAGFFIGCRMGRLCGGRAELFGGLLLISIGLKILIDHVLA